MEKLIIPVKYNSEWKLCLKLVKIIIDILYISNVILITEIGNTVINLAIVLIVLVCLYIMWVGVQWIAYMFFLFQLYWLYTIRRITKYLTNNLTK